MFKYKNVFVIPLLMLVLCIINCGETPTGPDPDDPNNYPTTYDVKMTYIRTEIADHAGWDPGNFELEEGGRTTRTPSISLTWKDEYTATAEIENMLVLQEGNDSHIIYVVDPKRWKETWKESSGKSWGKPHAVGHKFILENEQTGDKLELTLIIDNPFFPSHPELEAKAAQFRLLPNGEFVDE